MRYARRATALLAAGAALIAPALAGAAHPSSPRAGGSAQSASAWRELPPSPEARTEVSAAAVGSSIYVLGGYGSASMPSTAVARFDSVRSEWSLSRPLPASVNHAGAASYGGNLYVVGGYTGTPFSLGIGTGGVADATTDFLRYDPATDTWSAMPPAPSERATAAVAVIGDELLVAGGANALTPLRTLEIFDFRTGRWRRGPDLPLATEHTAGAALGGYFYVVGGRPFYGGGTHRFVQRYDPREQSWSRVADLHTGRAGFAVAAACHRLVAFGGEDPGASASGTVAPTEIYDPARDQWEALPDMRTPRHGFGGAAVGNSVFALEGGPVTLLSISNVAEALDLDCPEAAPVDELAPDGTEHEADGAPQRSPGRRDGGPAKPDRGEGAPPAGRRPSANARPVAAGDERPLPFTGFALAPIALAGAALLGAGSALLLATSHTARRSPRRPSPRRRRA